MTLLLAAVFGALATGTIGPLLVASAETGRHDRQIAERDEDLEEWIVTRHRLRAQRLNELRQQHQAAGVAKGGASAQALAAVNTIVLYEYREELRQARAFRLRVEAEERWTHALVRRLRRRPLRDLVTPGRASRLVDFWSEGTERNALTWSRDDILSGLPQRATSRASA
jgi:hypothetical protein